MLKQMMAIVMIATMIQGVAWANSLSDPTAPPRELGQTIVKATLVLPSLQAVIVGGSQTGAVLNQRFVALNQKIDGFSLVRVAQGYVVLVKSNQSYRIQLDTVSVKDSVVQGQ
ncbi:hypothetical protein [Agarivorans sp. QJM3NY_33]|uniref:hypothetical protein n=1 Tax=Agarivorans sp. QJM3NY_33 TaxID=3421432 RepID=UPI003D7DC3D1